MTDIWDAEEPELVDGGADPVCPVLWKSRSVDSRSSQCSKLHYTSWARTFQLQMGLPRYIRIALKEKH